MSSNAVRRVAVVLHGRGEHVESALERLEASALGGGVELLQGGDATADLAVVLGGDGTMLRALHRFLGTSTPTIGVNFGRIGFLTSISGADLETGLARAFAGDFRVVELATITALIAGDRHEAVNDIVVSSSRPGRMIKLTATLDGESLGDTDCDGMICCTPSGSTAYNLSNGGPVIMRGLDAMAITFVAPHSLHARPLVVPRGLGLSVRNSTPEVPVTVLVDGREVGLLTQGQSLSVDVGADRALLALLPDVTFLSRYREVFLERR
jgi:NAD+ kinase